MLASFNSKLEYVICSSHKIIKKQGDKKGAQLNPTGIRLFVEKHDFKQICWLNNKSSILMMSVSENVYLNRSGFLQRSIYQSIKQDIYVIIQDEFFQF